MAVDTELKRRSIMVLGHRGNVFPPATSGIVAAERSMLLGAYSGITLGLGVSTGVDGELDAAIGGVFRFDSSIGTASLDAAIGGALVMEGNIGGAAE